MADEKVEQNEDTQDEAVQPTAAAADAETAEEEVTADPEPVAETAEEEVTADPEPVAETAEEESAAEAVAEEPLAGAEDEAEEAPATEEPAVEEPVAEAEPPSEEPVAEAELAGEPEAQAEAAPAPAEEPLAEAPAPSPPKKKKKRLPRSLRPQRTKRTRERPADRKPIARLPKPEHVRGRRQVRQGTVVSAGADKTIVVRVDVVKAHQMYKKVIRRSARLHAHDELNQAKVGDIVRIVETRPISRMKRWRLQEIVEAAK
jgi:small subunit ribosomal protein S17